MFSRIQIYEFFTNIFLLEKKTNSYCSYKAFFLSFEHLKKNQNKYYVILVEKIVDSHSKKFTIETCCELDKKPFQFVH